MNRFAVRLHKLMVALATPNYWRALSIGVAPTLDHERILRVIRFNTVIDIGANVGQFTLLVRNIAPHAQIIAFEPVTAAIKKFDRLFGRDPMVRLIRAAAGEARAESEIIICAGNDSSSLFPINDQVEKWAPEAEMVGREAIHVVRVDEVVHGNELVSPVLVKIDVQGYEAAVIRGLDELLPRIDFVICELSFMELYRGQAMAHDVIAQMAEHEFRVTGVTSVWHDRSGRPLQADFLFEPDRRHEPALPEQQAYASGLEPIVDR